MNMIQAARDTIELAKKFGYANTSSDIPDMDYPHILEMMEKMESVPMSQTKLGRWLGWIQASCVYGTNGDVSLEDCKNINKQHAD